MFKKSLLVISLVALLVAAYLAGWLEVLGDPERLRQLILASGAWGYEFFLSSFIFLQPLGIPGFPWIVAASLIWPIPVAIALSLLGSVGAGIAGFTLARYLARDWVAHRLPGRFHRYDKKLGEYSLRTVILVYLMFFLAPPIPWFFGLSQVRFLPFLVGATVGLIPGVVILVLLGGTSEQWIASPVAWISIWVVLGLLGLSVFVYRRQVRRHTALKLEYRPDPGINKRAASLPV